MNSLSIVVPAYNERKRLPATLEKLAGFLASTAFDVVEVIIVDDGSTDGTAALVQETALNDARFRLLSNPGNRGKGYAVRHGVLDAHSEWILVTDADLSTPLRELSALQAASSPIAIGSRALDRSKVTVHQPWIRELSGRTFNLVMRILTGLPFLDTQCGFKLFSRQAAVAVFQRQRIEGFGFDAEVLYIARKLGWKTVEVPVAWADVEGTKVSLLLGMNGFVDLARVLWNDARGYYR